MTAGTSTRLEELRTHFSGTILNPGEDGYDTARAVHNASIDRRPATIASCATTADIVDAVRFARAEGLELSVRGGGHNVAGRAVVDGALMIDLSPMRSVFVDPAARTARAGGGSLWRDFNRATALQGLATTGGAISTTGVAGLTLGGGLGWLMAKHALAADNLIAVELVTADGTVAHVTHESDADLMWALRGGGGNFGIAASLEFRLHPLATVTGGLIVHPIDAAGEMFRWYRDAVADAPDDLTVFAALVHAPDGSGAKIAGMLVFHTGTPEEAERDLAPYKAFGAPLMVEVGPMPYWVMNTILDAHYPKGLRNYWLSSFTTGLSDGLIDATIDRFASIPSQSTILFEHFHGAVCRVGATDTAVPHREPGWNLVLPTVWTDPADDEANITWTRETHAALGEFLSARRWLNYLADDQGEDAVRGAYGPNYERLREVKRRHDPENVFRHNHNIAP
jgi:FAD/FMN-containing dehydrogenase